LRNQKKAQDTNGAGITCFSTQAQTHPENEVPCVMFFPRSLFDQFWYSASLYSAGFTSRPVMIKRDREKYRCSQSVQSLKFQFPYNDPYCKNVFVISQFGCCAT